MLLNQHHKARIIIPLALLLAVVWTVFANWAFTEREDAVGHRFQVLERLNSAVAEQVNSLFKLTEVTLAAATRDWARNPDDTTILQAFAFDLRDRTDGVMDMVLIDRTGRLRFYPYATTGASTNDDLDLNTHDRGFLMAAQGTRGGIVLGTPLQLSSGTWLLPMAVVPIPHVDGGYLAAVIRLQRLAALHDLQRPVDGGIIGLLRTDGTVLDQAPFDAGVLSKSGIGANELAVHWQAAEKGTYTASLPLAGDRPSLISFLRLLDYPAYVFIAQDQEAVLGPWRWSVLSVAAALAVLSVLACFNAWSLLRGLRRLDSSSRRFADIAETVSDLVWEMDAHARFTYVSARYREFFDGDEEQVLGVTPEDLGWRTINDATRKRFDEAIHRRLSFADLHFVRVGGSVPMIVAITGRPFFDAQGTYLGHRGVVTDITERLRQEEERQRRAEREAQIGKMEALGQLAGGIAHDFNNLLGAILGFGQFLVQDTPADSPLRRYAERVVLAGQRGRGLVQQILAFSRRASGEPADIVVAGVVTDTVELLRATVPSTTTLTVENAGGDLTIRGDHSRISQVVLNLCVNASDALEHKDGEVRIAVLPFRDTHPAVERLRSGEATSSRPAVWQDEDGCDWVCLGHLAGERYVSIRVTDTGAGIPPENLPRLFDLFFSTKASRGGSGMGLAVVQRVVNESGGAIVVRTKLGHGSTFEVILPRADQVETLSKRADITEDTDIIVDEAAECPGTIPATILVVDDDVDFCDMLEASLRRMGHEVVASNSPLEALAAVQEDLTLWDIVITDLSMPGMRGDDLIRHIKAANSGIRCILCTGDSSTFGVPHALAAGADAFRTKPLDLDELGSLVDQMAEALRSDGKVRAPRVPRTDMAGA